MNSAESISHVVHTDVRVILRARAASSRASVAPSMEAIASSQPFRTRERRCENSTSGDGGLEVRRER